MLGRDEIDHYVDAHLALSCSAAQLEVHRQNRHRFGWQATLLYRYLDVVPPALVTPGLVLLRRCADDGAWFHARCGPDRGPPLRLEALHCCDPEAGEGGERGTWHNALLVVCDGAATALPLSEGAECCLNQLSPEARATLTGTNDTAVLPARAVPCALLWLHVALVQGRVGRVAHALRRRDPCGRGAQLFQMYLVSHLTPDPPEGADPRTVAARLWAAHWGWLVRTARGAQYAPLPP